MVFLCKWIYSWGFRLTKEELFKGRPYAPNNRKSGALQSPKVGPSAAPTNGEATQEEAKVPSNDIASISDSVISSSSSGLEPTSTVLLASSSQPSTPVAEPVENESESVQAAADSTTSLVTDSADENSCSQDGSVASSSNPLVHSASTPNLDGTFFQRF